MHPVLTHALAAALGLCLAGAAAAQAAASAPAATSAPPTSEAAAKAAKEAGAVVTASGLVYRSMKDGTGPSPKATDTVRVHYR
ncbi:MAG: hypothetical protein ACKVQR_09700, partial [Aquabacterium sp.]